MQNPELSEFGIILLFVIGAILFVVLGMVTSQIVRPFKPNPQKLSSYECGEEPIGDAWGQFNIKFYIIALIFLVFEVELIFLFPWGVVFGNEELIRQTNGIWGWFAVVEAILFVGILVLGLIYAWKKGFLDWIKSEEKVIDYQSPVPSQLYEEFNQRYQPKQ